MVRSAPAQKVGSAQVMFLSLRTLGEQEHIEQRYRPALFEADPGTFAVVAPVTLVFDIFRQGHARFRLVGHVAATLELTCGRCLEPFALAVDPAFDLQYVPRTQNVGEGELEIGEEDLTTAFYSDEQIDLGQLMSEQFHLALPMKPLCSEACRGLCPQCGANLNVASCACKPVWEDPRLAALKSLFKGTSQNK